jgi:hypothetical protein
LTEKKLPNAVQIAAERVRDMPTSTIEERIAKAARMAVETRAAKQELERGEWK